MPGPLLGRRLAPGGIAKNRFRQEKSNAWRFSEPLCVRTNWPS